MKRLIFLIFSVFAAACGTQEADMLGEGFGGKKNGDSSDAAALKEGGSGDVFVLGGQISPSKINQSSFKDIEDFASQELLKIQGKAKIKHSSYVLKDVPLKNLKSGAFLFLYKSGESVAEAVSDANGKFKIVSEKSGDVLKMAKRIPLTFVDGNGKAFEWCYNLYAEKTIAEANDKLAFDQFDGGVSQASCVPVKSGNVVKPSDEIAAITAQTTTTSAVSSGQTAEAAAPAASAVPVLKYIVRSSDRYIDLIAGDYDLDEKAHHVCNEKGFAIVLTASKRIQIAAQADYDRIVPIIEDYRVARGLNPDGSALAAPSSSSSTTSSTTVSASSSQSTATQTSAASPSAPAASTTPVEIKYITRSPSLIVDLIAGDYDLDANAHNICDERGFAKLLTAPKQVQIASQADYDRIIPVIEGYRVLRGLQPDGSAK